METEKAMTAEKGAAKMCAEENRQDPDLSAGIRYASLSDVPVLERMMTQAWERIEHKEWFIPDNAEGLEEAMKLVDEAAKAAEEAAESQAAEEGAAA